MSLQALQDGLLMQYSARSTEPSVVQKFVGDYAESILMSVPAADLLFQTANEAAAAWCYRMPEQLVCAGCCMTDAFDFQNHVLSLNKLIRSTAYS